MTITKRFTSLIIALSLVFTLGLSAFAAGGDITDLSATLSGNTVTVSGYTSDVKAAVFVQLREGNKVLASDTFNVNDMGSFSGVLRPDDNTTLDADTEYTVWTADIDGGLWKITSINVSAATVKGYRLRLDGYIGVEYYIKLDESLANNDTTVTFTQDCVEEALREQSVRFEDASYDNTQEAYVFLCKVTSAEMTIPVKATLTNGDTAIAFDDFMVRDYARTLIAMDIDETTTDLAAALLSYGYYSQVKFNIGGDRFEEDKVEFADAKALIMPSVEDRVDGVRYYGASVVFLSGSRLRQYYEVTAPQATFRINDVAQTPVKNNGYYYIQTDEIPINKVDMPVYFEISNGTDEPYVYGFTPLNYVAAILASDTASAEMKDLANAYFTYYKAAQAYSLAH